MNKQSGGPAPTYFTDQHAISMTLRDYFAAKAMQTLLGWDDDLANWNTYAKYAYEMADEMLKAREA